MNLGESLIKNPLHEAQLDYQKSNQMYHIQHTLESPLKAKEAEHIQKHRELFKDRKDHGTVIASTLDGDIRKGKGKFKKVLGVNDFHEKLLAMCCAAPRGKLPETMENFNGFATGLTREELQELIDASTKACKVIIPGDEDFKKADKKTQLRYCNVMLLNFNALLAIKQMLKFGNDANQPQTATMGQACKQDVDRGPVVNAATITFVQLIANGRLSGQDAKQLIGMLLMRGLMVDGRLMNNDRLEILLDLLYMMGRSENIATGFVKALQDFAGKKEQGPSPISFIPSHHVHPPG